MAIQQPAYAADLPGAGDDLVQAIAACITVLQGGKAPAAFRIASKKEALRLLVHHVGDLHQPLHVGAIYLDDQGKPLNPASAQEAQAHRNSGGNAILVGARNLHALWDDVPGKLTTRPAGRRRCGRGTPGAASSGPPEQWPAQWGSDTLRVAPQAFQPLKFGRQGG